MIETLTGKWAPREIALAIALGFLIGIMPKLNLIVAVLTVLFFLSDSTILLGLVTIAVISLCTPWIDPWTHQLGAEILLSPTGNHFVAAFFQVPPLPWTMLDNTVVLGAFVAGIVLFFPLFLSSWVVFKLVWLLKQSSQKSEALPNHQER